MENIGHAHKDASEAIDAYHQAVWGGRGDELLTIIAGTQLSAVLAGTGVMEPCILADLQQRNSQEGVTGAGNEWVGDQATVEAMMGCDQLAGQNNSDLIGEIF